MGIQYDLLLMPMSSANPIDIACRSAALVYTKSLTREDACNFDPVIEPMIAALKMVEVNDSNAKMLLWVNFMGAAFAKNMHSRVWFHKQVAMLRKYLRLGVWFDAESILQGISWIRAIHDQAGHLVWVLLDSMSTSSMCTPELQPP